MISIVGSVLDRPKIKEEFTNKYTEILKMLDTEMSMCEEIFRMQIHHKRQHGYLFVDRSCPPVTGSLRWVLQLTGRITPPIKSFRALQHS